VKLPEKRIWFGSQESIFDMLPANVLANFRSARSENALLWNTVYKLSKPAISLHKLLGITPVWGTQARKEEPDDQLIPYYWGFGVDGARMEGLDEALLAVDGSGPATEVDLFLLGEKHLIAVEAKHTSGFGRCSRYQQGRCPEIHPERAVERSCRYWDEGVAQFSQALRIGERPAGDMDTPPCSRHYQLSRTLLLGRQLAHYHQRTFSMWLIVSKTGWRSLELDWLDFTDRVRDSEVWRRLRVITWEQLNALG
jgi:hypothetical protein